MPDFSRQRAERDFNRNPPNNAPGQGQAGASGWDAMEEDPNVNGMDNIFSGNQGGSDINDILNGQQGMGVPGQQQQFGNQNQMPMPNQMPVPGQQMNQNMYPQGPTAGEKLENALVDVGKASAKGLINFFKVFGTALANNSARDWHKLGTVMSVLSLVIMAFGGLLVFIGFLTVIHNVATLFLIGCSGFFIGFLIVAKSKSKMVKEREIESSDGGVSGSEEPEEMGSSGFTEFDFPEDDAGGDSEGDSPVWDFDDEGEDTWFGDEDSSASSDDFDPAAEANKIDVPPGQYTRSYLVETFLKVLPNINPSFYKMDKLYEDDDDFMQFNEYLRDSAMQTGLTGDKLDEVYLISVESNPFVIRLTCTRPSGIKEQEIADGLADCYKRDESGSIIPEREGCYASVDVQVGKFAINIFKCANIMVSLGDVLKYKKDFISDPKVIMPLFWGVNEMGRVYCYDGIKAGNGSMLISGEGRSGKSWKGQSLIAQMSMFMSPKEINFYFFDNKAKLSDYYYLSTKLPHVKGFCGDPLKYVSELQKILDREKPIREKAIHEAGVNNINDYNKFNPTKKLPYIYIVVDEMAAAMKEMDAKDKELHKQFNSIMLSIVTNLPYFGIRLLLFPHRLVDFIIDKTTAQQISCRSVVGVLDFETLKSALDIRNKKDFPYNLVKPGDMAIRTKDIRNGVATFTKSEVLSDSEATNRKIFDYIGAVWGKLEPDCKPCVSFFDGSNTGNGGSGGVRRSPKDTSSDVGDYSVRGAFDTMFTDVEPEGASLDELLGDNNGEDDFWKAFGGRKD